ncbi:DNA repair protein RecO (recombination protein O) [Bacillus pakistanensis]|uniref:DNA repair protein RecO n=1 Tax=Rossellomorea pakistanensis TaxID=992288 RepID=A0ABS2NA94_9BACI|nr:DNA repair protein RecO [Bacillus pakistanensis]MBM7584715.1 DNA repair protein RecO (recombination protein O) [Bacillus pakistanensis]
MLQKCEGIVIRTNQYGESNKVVTIFSREFGKIGVMARGARKPNSRLSSVSQLFTYGHFLFQKSTGLGTLQQGEIISTYRHIREDLFKTAYATYIVDLLDKGTDEKKPDPYLYELLSQTIHYIDEGYDPDILTNIFEMKMLPVLGLYPNLNQCAVCGEKEGTFSFSFKENGLICHRCKEKDPYHMPLLSNTVKLLRLFYYFDLSRLGNVSVKDVTKEELKKVIRTYYDEYSGLALKSRRFLDQMDHLKGLL